MNGPEIARALGAPYRLAGVRIVEHDREALLAELAKIRHALASAELHIAEQDKRIAQQERLIDRLARHIVNVEHGWEGQR